MAAFEHLEVEIQQLLCMEVAEQQPKQAQKQEERSLNLKFVLQVLVQLEEAQVVL